MLPLSFGKFVRVNQQSFNLDNRPLIRYIYFKRNKTSARALTCIWLIIMLLAGCSPASTIPAASEYLMLQSNMLQTERNRAALTVASRSEQAKGGGIGELVNFAIALLRRQYAVILVTAALALAASIVYLRVAPPTYTAQVQILLGAESKAEFVQQQSLLGARHRRWPSDRNHHPDSQIEGDCRRSHQSA